MIELRNLTVTQGSFHLSVQELSLKQGDFVGILGNNGSGKSTFLHAISGLKPFTGQYELSGLGFSSISLKRRSRLISFLPQAVHLSMPFDVFYVVLTGRFPCTAGSRYGKEDIDATEQILRQMDIFHLQERPFYTLSGGEKQRVLLARTLNRNSTVVALDEPLTGIDIRHQQESVQYLKSIIREKLILVVIHDISVALATFNRFLFFINGVLAYDLKQDSINESVLFEVFGVRLNILKHENNMVVYL